MGCWPYPGLLVLLYYAFTHPTTYPKLAIGLFIAAALGGIYMFLTSGPDKAKPIPIAGLHALLAVSGLVTLLVYVFGDARRARSGTTPIPPHPGALPGRAAARRPVASAAEKLVPPRQHVQI